jgi:hypothetical protein
VAQARNHRSPGAIADRKESGCSPDLASGSDWVAAAAGAAALCVILLITAAIVIVSRRAHRYQPSPSAHLRLISQLPGVPAVRARSRGGA